MKTYIDNYHGKDWKNWHKDKEWKDIPIGEELEYYFGGYEFSDKRLMWHEMTKNHLKKFQRKVARIYAAKFGESIYNYTNLKREDLEEISFYYIPPREWINTFMLVKHIKYTGTLADMVSKRR